MAQHEDRDDGGAAEQDAGGIASMVAAAERSEGMLVIGVMALCIIVPVVSGILRGHPILGLANALLLGLAGWCALLVVHVMLLRPINLLRYARAAERLGRALRSHAGPAGLHRCWSDGAPGAIAIAADGRVWLADRSTGYRIVALAADAIVDAHAISISTVRQKRRGPAIGIGVPLGGGLIGTWSMGRESGSTVRAHHALLLHYRAAPDGPVRTTSIPFDRDVAGVSAMVALLRTGG